jgi:polyphosphate kinase 2 (PPK2 family)
VEEMLAETDHDAARWQVVAAESKHYARVRVLEIVISTIEDALRAHGQTPIEAEAAL